MYKIAITSSFCYGRDQVLEMFFKSIGQYWPKGLHPLYASAIMFVTHMACPFCEIAVTNLEESRQKNVK